MQCFEDFTQGALLVSRARTITEADSVRAVIKIFISHKP